MSSFPTLSAFMYLLSVFMDNNFYSSNKYASGTSQGVRDIFQLCMHKHVWQAMQMLARNKRKKTKRRKMSTVQTSVTVWAALRSFTHLQCACNSNDALFLSLSLSRALDHFLALTFVVPLSLCCQLFPFVVVAFIVTDSFLDALCVWEATDTHTHTQHARTAKK